MRQKETGTQEQQQPANSCSITDCLLRLEKYGILLKCDSRLPSAASLVAMERIRGSWWAHPASHAIFKAIQNIAMHPAVLVVKLVCGKDTFVHKQLWPDLLAIATGNEQRQFEAPPANARLLYERVLSSREVEGTGATARLLESRLLVRGEQFHSENDNHKKRLESWNHWAERVGLSGCELPPVPKAKRTFEGIYHGTKWPWTNSR